MSCLPGVGIFGVELFQMPDGSIMLNEVAPRPHNSGHYTIEACGCSQFEAHVRVRVARALAGRCCLGDGVGVCVGVGVGVGVCVCAGARSSRLTSGGGGRGPRGGLGRGGP